MSIGRSGSLPLPKNVDSAPSAAATGIINLRVEPLSLQSISASADGFEIPFTVTISPLTSTDAPSAVTAEIVASMSFDIVTPLRTETPSASAAQISERCAQLFDAGISTAPLRDDGVIFISIIFPP